MNSLLAWRPAELPDSWALYHGWTWSWVLPLVAIVALAAMVVLASSRAAALAPGASRMLNRIVVGVLGLSALLAVGTYLDFGVFRYGSYLNEWDFYHYYVGTKYAPELGYTKLYGATLAADTETGLRYQPADGKIRDLGTAELRDVAAVAAEAAHYRAAFSDTRWREFVGDVAYFKVQLPPNRWSLILADHGFNGTPAWSFVVGALITRNLSVQSPLSRWLMLLLDPALLIAGVLAVAWAFGGRAALLTVVFIGTHYLFSWGHLKGALLRTDFAMASLLAVCLVKRERYKLAGALLGWAVVSRVFPVFLLLPPAVLLVHGYWRHRRWDRGWAMLALTSAATVAVVVLGSCIYFGGLGIWHEWGDKIARHYAGGSDWDLGLRTILEAKFAHGVPIRPATLAQFTGETLTSTFHPIELAAIGLLALPALAFLPALERYEAVAYGFVFVFLFSNATYYYYLILCVPFVFFAARPQRLGHALGAAFMFVTCAAGYGLFSGSAALRNVWVGLYGWRQTFPTYYFISCLIAVTVAQLIVMAGLRARKLERERRRKLPVPSAP